MGRAWAIHLGVLHSTHGAGLAKKVGGAKTSAGASDANQHVRQNGKTDSFHNPVFHRGAERSDCAVGFRIRAAMPERLVAVIADVGNCPPQILKLPQVLSFAARCLNASDLKTAGGLFCVLGGQLV